MVNLQYDHEYNQVLQEYRRAWQAYKPYLEDKDMSKGELNAEERLNMIEIKFNQVCKKMFG